MRYNTQTIHTLLCTLAHTMYCEEPSLVLHNPRIFNNPDARRGRKPTYVESNGGSAVSQALGVCPSTAPRLVLVVGHGYDLHAGPQKNNYQNSEHCPGPLMQAFRGRQWEGFSTGAQKVLKPGGQGEKATAVPGCRGRKACW